MNADQQEMFVDFGNAIGRLFGSAMRHLASESPESAQILTALYARGGAMRAVVDLQNPVVSFQYLDPEGQWQEFVTTLPPPQDRPN